MKFLIDMPLSPALANCLRALGHDAVHAGDIGLHRASDEVIIAKARQENRVIVTADLDYPRLLAITVAEGPGLILFRGGNWSEVDVRVRLEKVLEMIPDVEIACSILTVDQNSIRRRRLPIKS